MCTMYKKNTQKNAPNKNKTGYLSMLEEESLPRSDFLNIWRVNPSFRHIKQKRILLRAIPVLLFFNFLALISYYIFNNIFFSVGISIFATTGIFFEQLVNVFKKIFKIFHEITQVNPFEHFRICKLIEDPASILIINKKSATNVIVRVFQVDVLPEEFLKGLEHRRAIVIDGVNGYKYEIYTPDFDYPKFKSSRLKYINM